MIGFIAITVFYALNAVSAKLGGHFQNLSMFIKLIPLVLIAILGIAFGHPAAEFSAATGEAFKTSARDLAWLGAFGPIAFSYDGWIVSTSICHEIKNSKRNLPLALTVAPIAVLIVYLAYFIGITSYLGADQVLALGDDSVFTAATGLFGGTGAKLVLIAVVISILGTVNGVCLGLIRLPHALALRNMMPFSDVFSKENEKLGGMPLNSSILVYVLSIVYLGINDILLSSKNEFVAGLDISEISICVLYLIYIALYVAVIKLARKGEIKNKFLGYVAPVLATIGSLIIFSGSVVKASFAIYAAICILFLGVAYLYYRQNKAYIVIKTDEEYDLEEKSMML